MKLFKTCKKIAKGSSKLMFNPTLKGTKIMLKANTLGITEPLKEIVKKQFYKYIIHIKIHLIYITSNPLVSNNEWIFISKEKKIISPI